MSYSAPATVTPTKLEADLGALGRIAVDILPGGKKRKLRSRCGAGTRLVEPHLYRGSFEFHGELGYADAVAIEAPEDVGFFADIVCARVAHGEESGAGLPGARLRARGALLRRRGLWPPRRHGSLDRRPLARFPG